VILLDTGVISESMRPEPLSTVLEWIRSVREDRVYLPSLVVGELKKGVDRLPDGSRKSALTIWFEPLRDRFRRRILPFDEETALSWGRLAARCERDGHPMPAVDSLIAAYALRHEAILATRNTDRFAHAGIDLVDPWEYRA